MCGAEGQTVEVGIAETLHGSGDSHFHLIEAEDLLGSLCLSLLLSTFFCRLE
jgi:hypothetical protein